MRVDKAKNIANLSKELLDNPLQTVREIWNTLDLDFWTVAKLKKELPQIATKDDRIIWLTDKDFELMQKIQEVKFKRIADDEQINNSDIDKWEQTATKRYTIFRWDATDKDWGLKTIDSIDIL